MNWFYKILSSNSYRFEHSVNPQPNPDAPSAPIELILERKK